MNPKVAKCFTKLTTSIMLRLNAVKEALLAWHSSQLESERTDGILCISRLSSVLQTAIDEPCAHSDTRWAIARDLDRLYEYADSLMRKIPAGAPKEVRDLFYIHQELWNLVYGWPLPETGLTDDEERRAREVVAANRFLEAYNGRFGTDYAVSHHQDRPDFVCLDAGTGRYLYLEVTDLVDKEDDLAYSLGRSLRKSMGAISWDDTLGELRRVLENKPRKNYKQHPLALVIRQINPLWSLADWQACARKHNLHAQYADLPFDHGVWILTWSDSAPPRYDIFCLTPPV